MKRLVVLCALPWIVTAAKAAGQYDVRLSDTSLSVVSPGGHRVAMHFPKSRPETNGDRSRARYRNIFSGVDLVVYPNRTGFEYDWVAAPGADTAAIRFTFSGADYRKIADGDLVLGTPEGEVRHSRPLAYQEMNGVKTEVACAFEILPGGAVTFRLGNYDRTRPLTIDPSLTFASGIGGKGFIQYLGHGYQESDSVSSMATDASGNIYIAGLERSTDFPLVHPLPPAPAFRLACPASFVAKLSPDGGTLLYSTLLTSCSNSAPSLAADKSGNVYVAGVVSNGSSLVQMGGSSVMAAGSDDGFLVALDAAGSLKAAIKFGGAGADKATSIALGNDGLLYLTGTTGSQDFPISPAAFRRSLSSSQDIFLMRLDPSQLASAQIPAVAISYSTLLGPGDLPLVAADASGSAWLAAFTTSTAWSATAGAVQSQCRTGTTDPACQDLIALKVNPNGSQLLSMTYLGGSGYDAPGAIALDGSGALYVTGTTSSPDFPTTPNAWNKTGVTRPSDAFAVKLSADATRLIYATFFLPDMLPNPYTNVVTAMSGAAIAVDSSGNAWVGGYISGSALNAPAGFQQTPFNLPCEYYTPDGSSETARDYCPQAGYLIELNASGSAPLWQSYLGGGSVNSTFSTNTPQGASVDALSFDSSGNLFAAGSGLAITGAVASPSSKNDASVAKISLAGNSLGDVFVESAAGFAPGIPAAGGLAALYVTGIPATGTIVAPGLPVPTQLGGVTVTVNGVPAPILSVSSLASPPNRAQVNFQVPSEIPVSSPQSYVVQVSYGGQSAFVVPQQAGPSIFTTADGAGVIQHAADYSLVTAANPVKRGETLVIYATGLGPVTAPIRSGTGALSADPVVGCNPVTTNAGTVLYAGLTPGFPGLYQVNVQVSGTLPQGNNNIYLQSLACWLEQPPQNVYQGNSVSVPVQ